MEAASSGFCVILLLFALTTVIASTLLYLFEAPQCLQGWVTPGDELYAIPPQDCTAQSNFDSIPAVFWWAVTTLTTVGYGDMVPTSPAGKVVAGLMCVCGVMIMIVASAQFSLLFRERWVQAKARDHFRRQLESHSDSALARELDEVEQLAASMRHAVDQLVARVAGASLEVGGESTPAEVAPLLMSIRAHASVLNLGTSAFIYDALASALLESEAKSAIPEEGPPDAEGFLERRTSMNDVGSAPTTAAIVRQLSPAGACPGSRLDRLRKYGRATTTALTEEEMHPLEEASGAIDAAERRRSEPGLVALRSPDRFGEDAAAVAEGAGAGAGPPPTGLAPELPDEDGEADGCAALPGAVLEPRAQARARPATAGEEDGIDADGEAEGCATAAAPALPAALPAAAPERSGAAAGEADGEDDGRAAGSATAPPAAVAARPAGAAGADGDDAADDALR
ncbi:unnamed protein product [Prorocentrum cordatum]|uniref:Potassium channel domain-containing protein n=1 Tax=Prorocentrum cordatum TaxID=2364126 RepID=A0ABN9V4R5_9DINO|nr:unnamed protein product [Polarella glacialis]